MNKLKLINDKVLGNIPFSKLESLIFSHQLCNRLHHITQNSMAFRVFPSDRTSRFPHSIGVMHISSLMFKNGLSNTKQETFQKYFNKKTKIVKNILEEAIEEIGKKDFYYKHINDKIRNKSDSSINFKFLYSTLIDFLGEKFVNQITFSMTDIKQNPQNKFTYLILISALRIKGLLHDIGHLPFSHLSEYAFEDIGTEIMEKRSGNNIKGFEKRVLEIIDQKIFSSNNKIHESFGKEICDIIFQDLNEQKEDCESLLFLFTIHNIINEMSKARNGSFSELYRIISSDFDSDRLDFVMRDGSSSGLIKKTGDFGRIIKMFCLVEYTRDNKTIFDFLPSVQALNDIQEVLKDRYRIYKFLVHHHKVKKMDYLIQNSIIKISKEEIKQNDSFFNGAILQNIIDIIYLFDCINRDKISNKKLCYEIFQITDNWMWTKLNQKYADLLYDISSQSSDENISDKKLHFKAILEEALTGKKNFESLWKREHEYNSFINKFNKKIKKENNDLLEKVKKIKKENENKDDANENIPESREVITALKLLQVYDKLQEKMHNDGYFVLLVPVNIKLGINDLKLTDLKKQEKLYDFKKISEVFNFIKEDRKNFIDFFVFYNSEFSEIRNNNMKEKIEEALMENIINFIKEY